MTFSPAFRWFCNIDPSGEPADAESNDTAIEKPDPTTRCTGSCCQSITPTLGAFDSTQFVFGVGVCSDCDPL